VDRLNHSQLRQEAVPGTAVRARSFRVLGVRIDALQIPEVIEKLEEWIRERRRSHFVALANVNNVMEARKDPGFRKIQDSADLALPDGMPLVWMGRLHGHPLRRRVYGPDLLLDFCRQTEGKGYSHFFYGGAPGIGEQLAEEMKRRFPGTKIAGVYSPPFRALNRQEDASIVEMINQAAPDVLWVGLGCPKQERWIYEHRNRLRVPVIAGIGQAFDIHSGRVTQAPRWMREHGLEWLFRFCSEPRRLWRRYLVYNAEFLFSLLVEIAGVRRFE
jgi:N-acetylglucosaminyldiphosphoundecaprenol N-acetyl-beta-D-mannosaminyltransferase